MIKKLRKKFIIIATVAVASVMVLLCVILNTANFISVNSKLNGTLDMISTNSGKMPEFERQMPDKKPDGEAPERRFDMGGQFNEETPFSTRFFVLCYNANGELISSNLEQIAAVTQSDTDTYLSVALKHGEGYGFADGYKYKVTAQPDGSFMAVFLDSYREISSVYTTLWLSLAATLICIVLICVIIVLFSKRAMEPVAESVKKQKQFITDASHELKTPITVIATSMGVLEMEVGKQKWIDKTKAQTEKLKQLVDSLVTLAKIDELEAPAQLREFNISEAMSETAESFCDFAEQSGHTLKISVEPAVHYCGDEYEIRQLASILLDNAIKYAAPDSEIEFSLEKGKRGAVLKTANLCEGLDVTELDRLFDRFYRADKSRSEKSGFGIGLSIARGICEAHKGSIKAQSADGKKVEFIAELK